MYTLEAEDGPYLPSILVNIKKGDVIIGRFILNPITSELYQVHLSPVKKSERGHTREIAYTAMKMAFEGMKSLQKIIAYIPESNILVRKMADYAGLTYEGRIHEGYLQDGKMVDLEIYGITRREVEQ